MKNRRNTRRGRAKRWYLNGGHGLRCLRRSDIYVSPSTGPNLVGRMFAVVSLQNYFDTGKFTVLRLPTRAAAMRAAEHLARRR